MKKTLYSLMLNEEVVREIDRMAHRMGHEPLGADQPDPRRLYLGHDAGAPHREYFPRDRAARRPSA